MKFRLSYLIMAAAVLLSSCKEESLKTWSGGDYLHFTYSSAGKTPLVLFNFATYGDTRQTEVEVPVKLTLWGNLPKKDFPYNVSIAETGTTAPSGYCTLPGQMLFHAGLPEDILYVKVKREDALLATSYRVVLEMKDGSDYIVGPLSYGKAFVDVVDRVEEPSWWRQSVAAKLGEYSGTKFRVFCIYLGKYLENLDGYTGITFAEEISDFKAWWAQQFATGNYVYYDTDSTTPLYETIQD